MIPFEGASVHVQEGHVCILFLSELACYAFRHQTHPTYLINPLFGPFMLRALSDTYQAESKALADHPLTFLSHRNPYDRRSPSTGRRTGYHPHG